MRQSPRTGIKSQYKKQISLQNLGMDFKSIPELNLSLEACVKIIAGI